MRDLGPVAHNLASRKTDLGGFFRGLEAFSGALAPVAQTQADLYVNLDTTFRALAPVAVPFLQDWISETPPTFSAVIADSPAEQAFLPNTARLFKELRPGFATLPQSAPVLADAFAAGTQQRCRAPRQLDARLLEPVQARWRRYAQTPAVNGGLDRLTLTRQEPAVAAGVPDPGAGDLQLRVAVPAQHRRACWPSRSATAPRCASTWS